MSFLKHEANNRLSDNNKLVKLSKMISWEGIGEKLKGIYDYEKNGKGGQKPYDSLKMFKALLLGQWHSLSDPELEEALKVRLDFMVFTDFTSKVPDDTTLCRFRNRLVALGLDVILFQEINEQLEANQLKLKKCEGAVIDATILDSSSRPRKIVKLMPEDREEEIEQPQDKAVLVEYSKDPEARWLKKRAKNYFGYKAFIATDVGDGYIESVHVTPANKSEMGQLESVIPDNKPQRVYADKGYSSKENRALLKSKKIKDAIMEKAARNRPLSFWQKKKNFLISRKRFIVEQAFGTLKRRFNFNRVSYVGQPKVKAQMVWKAICFNLLKAVNKVELAK